MSGSAKRAWMLDAVSPNWRGLRPRRLVAATGSADAADRGDERTWAEVEVRGDGSGSSSGEPATRRLPARDVWLAGRLAGGAG